MNHQEMKELADKGIHLDDLEAHHITGLENYAKRFGGVFNTDSFHKLMLERFDYFNDDDAEEMIHAMKDAAVTFIEQALEKIKANACR